MDRYGRRLRRLGAAFGVVAVMVPGWLHAQDTIPAIPQAQLDSFAKAYVEIAAVRDESYGELGRTHEAQGKAAIREKMEQRITQILEAHGLTPAQYRRYTWAISAVPEQRAAFEKALAAAMPKKEGG